MKRLIFTYFFCIVVVSMKYLNWYKTRIKQTKKTKLKPLQVQTINPASFPWTASWSSVCLASTSAKSAAGLLIFISLSFTRRQPHASQIQENKSERGRREGGINLDKSQFFHFIGFYFMCNNAFSPARRGHIGQICQRELRDLSGVTWQRGRK